MNTYFRWYYNKDCKCTKSMDKCKKESLTDKSHHLLCEYPCVPCSSIVNNKNPLNKQDIWDIHRKLVDAHNKLCDELANNEPDRTKVVTYKYINYI